MPHTKRTEFKHISEYEALPFHERKPYVTKLLSMHRFALEGGTEREQWVNEARMESAKLHKELEGFKSSFWFRLYKMFA